MTDCPYCHSNTTIRYSPVISLHIVRSFIGSDKRYCSHCEKKWKVRSHRKRVNTSFYAVAIPLTLVFSLGMFRLTSGGAQAFAKSGNSPGLSSGFSSAGGGTLQKMLMSSEVFLMKKAVLSKAGGGKMESQMLAGLSGSNRKMAERALKTMSTEDIQSKLKKLQANPQALSRLSGERREVVEQALKFMKSQDKK